MALNIGFITTFLLTKNLGVGPPPSTLEYWIDIFHLGSLDLHQQSVRAHVLRAFLELQDMLKLSENKKTFVFSPVIMARDILKSSCLSCYCSDVNPDDKLSHFHKNILNKEKSRKESSCHCSVFVLSGIKKVLLRTLN